MKPITKGDKGAEVKKWQFFLVGQGYKNVVADGSFGNPTFLASIDFQKKNLLSANGIIDNPTYLKAMQFGFQLVDDHPENDDENSSAWPPPPDFRPLSYSVIQNMFGPVEFKIKPDKSSVTITNNFQASNIVSFDVPQIKGLPPYKASKISVHKKVSAQFQSLFNEWEKAGFKS